jgi:glycosyltransferase involved in cell wall biosynthesis
MKRLLIISHTPHFRRGDHIVGLAATVREIDYLADLFDQVVHLAPLHEGESQGSTSPYTSNRVVLHPVKPAGGAGLLDKVGIVGRIPEYWIAIGRELKSCDAVHVRCPANISLIAILRLALTIHPSKRWLKYAGNWKPEQRTPLSYSFQRWWLAKGWHRGTVTVNGEWPDQPSHLLSFFNPSLSEEDLEHGRESAERKNLVPPIRLLFVGRLEEAKGAGRVLDIAAELKRNGVELKVDMVGDGPERSSLENRAHVLGLDSDLFFHGWLSHKPLAELYAVAHFFVLPTRSEGWPKVISEGMACGALPVAGAVGSIPQYLQRFGCGKAIDPMSVGEFVRTIREYLNDPQKWKSESMNAVNSAGLFSYREYLNRVRSLFRIDEVRGNIEPEILEAGRL